MGHYDPGSWYILGNPKLVGYIIFYVGCTDRLGHNVPLRFLRTVLQLIIFIDEYLIRSDIFTNHIEVNRFSSVMLRWVLEV